MSKHKKEDPALHSLELAVGHTYKCINPVIMEYGEIAYFAGLVYKCENPRCLTDEQGDKQHLWLSEDPGLFFIENE